MAEPLSQDRAHTADQDSLRIDDTSPAVPAVRHNAGNHPAGLGGYRIEQLLGEGGMGAVYRARDDRLDRPVAIKTMRPEIAAVPGAADRFLREARTAAQLSHDHVIPIWQVGEEAGTPFIVMPLLRGQPLDTVLKKQGQIPVKLILMIGREMAAGLAAAHALGLIHRDIKPANVWLERRDGPGTAAGAPFVLRPSSFRVKILDFGLARAITQDARLTVTGAVLGTPAYMSPEQARGRELDARTDLFSLGGMLYEMAVGERPFTGDSYNAVLMELATHTPIPPADQNPAIPRRLSDLIMKLLEKDRDRRIGSATEVLAELDEIANDRRSTSSASMPVVLSAAENELPLAEPARCPARRSIAAVACGSPSGYSASSRWSPPGSSSRLPTRTGTKPQITSP